MSTTKTVAVIIGGFILIIALIVGGIYLTGTIKKETAGFRGEVDANEQIQADGSFRISAYDSFFNLCSSVQSDEDRITALQQELESDPSDRRRDQITASITAVRASRAEKINRYNADANKDYTVGQFRDSGLPFRLDTDSNTECEA